MEPRRAADLVAAANGPTGAWFLRRAWGERAMDSWREWFMAAPCAYCLGVATTIDHIVPKSRGGTLALENSAPACVTCNGTKGDMPVLVFMAEMYERDPSAVGKARRAAAYVALNASILELALETDRRAYNRRRRT